MSNLTTIDTNNFAAMAKAMGMTEDTPKAKSNNLARLRIYRDKVMGIGEVKGKKVKVEVVPEGSYRIAVPDGPTYFSSTCSIRPFMQRFMYKRYVSADNKYIKTLMADNLNVDLKDDSGGFNCGKPAGYIQDFQALPDNMKELIRAIKRVRVLFGTVTLDEAYDEEGNLVEGLDPIPFIWEIDNRDAFKTVGEAFGELTKMKRLPPQHLFNMGTIERPMNNGSFFVPSLNIDFANSIELDDATQDLFRDFMSWVDNYNDYIVTSWSEKTVEDMSDDDINVIEDMVDIEIEEDVA